MKKPRREREPAGGEPAARQSGAAHEYFRELEEVFIALRGAPLLLSPADWETAQEWFRLGIPLDVVERVLREIFERNPERKGRAGVRSLRYFDSAVQRAWAEARELSSDVGYDSAEPLDIPARLKALAAAIPEKVDGWQEARQEVLALSGDAKDVEVGLAALDARVLERGISGLEPSKHETIDSEVSEALERLGTRLPPKEHAEMRLRLRLRAFRRRLRLPVLSLFSPEASSPRPRKDESNPD